MTTSSRKVTVGQVVRAIEGLGVVQRRKIKISSAYLFAVLIEALTPVVTLYGQRRNALAGELGTGRVPTSDDIERLGNVGHGLVYDLEPAALLKLQERVNELEAEEVEIMGIPVITLADFGEEEIEPVYVRQLLPFLTTEQSTPA